MRSFEFEKPEIQPESNTPFAFPPGPAITWAFFRFLFAKVLRKNLGLSKTWVSVSGSYAMSAEADMGI